MDVACLMAMAGAAISDTTLPDVAVAVKEPLAIDMRLRLSMLHFLEFAVWGAWWVVLGQYLEALRFTRKAVGNTYATMSLAAIISPLFIGALADRYFPSQYVLGVLHLTGGATLLALAYITRQRSFYWVTLLYSLLYTPTMSLANAITLVNVPDPRATFRYCESLERLAGSRPICHSRHSSSRTSRSIIGRSCWPRDCRCVWPCFRSGCPTRRRTPRPRPSTRSPCSKSRRSRSSLACHS